MQYMGGSSGGSKVLHKSSFVALHKASSWGRRRVTSAGEINEPASNVNVNNDRRTNIARQIL